MLIKSLRVDEGFFDGLKIQFSPGLNVLIGGRGVGKTSVIELLRFGLGGGGLTKKATQEALTHAVSVLRSGKVFIEVEVDGQSYELSRTANDEHPISKIKFQSPIVFSQTEIESIGLDSSGRLELVDSFIDRSPSRELEVTHQITTARSLAAALLEQSRVIEDLKETLPDEAELSGVEESLVKQQKTFEKEHKDIQATQETLGILQGEIGKLSVFSEHLNRFLDSSERWVMQLRSLGEAPSLDQASEFVPKMHISVGVRAEEIQKGLTVLATEAVELTVRGDQYLQHLRELLAEIRTKKSQLDDEARALRKVVDSYSEAAGTISRDLGNVRKKMAHAKDAGQRMNGLVKRYRETIELLRMNVRAIEVSRSSLFNERKKVAARLSADLTPTITVDVVHSARIGEYDDALKAALQGSNLRYKEITGIVASTISPEELLDLIKDSRYQDFADALDIPLDRATRVLAHLQSTNLGQVLTANVYDDIQLGLLDGSRYKGPDELSIGQRCTVSLAIVLENRTRGLLIDQPEDHLDNEFIAKTLIKSLQRRADSAQTIVSSHNANIPVLANAARVICLGSNGRRGYVQCSGDLTSRDIVVAIESIMEGGKNAFAARAKFYKSDSDR